MVTLVALEREELVTREAGPRSFHWLIGKGLEALHFSLWSFVHATWASDSVRVVLDTSLTTESLLQWARDVRGRVRNGCVGTKTVVLI